VKNAQKVPFGGTDETCPECTFGQQKCSQTNPATTARKLEMCRRPKNSLSGVLKNAKFTEFHVGNGANTFTLLKREITSMSMPSKSQSLIFEESN